MIPYPNMFSLPLQNFGCICFVPDHSSNHTKLDHKAFKYAFLRIQEVKKDIDVTAPRCISLGSLQMSPFQVRI